MGLGGEGAFEEVTGAGGSVREGARGRGRGKGGRGGRGVAGGRPLVRTNWRDTSLREKSSWESLESLALFFDAYVDACQV